MPLEKYKSQDSIKQVEIAKGSGLRAVGDMWEQVGKTGSAVADMAYEEGVRSDKIRGEEEGQRAIWTDPETGKVTNVGTLPSGTKPYDVAYRKAAEAQYQSELGLSAMTKMSELVNANQGNPEGFRHAAAGYMKGIVDSVPVPIKPSVDLMLKELAVKNYYHMQQDHFEQVRGEAKVSTMNLVDAYEKDTVDQLRTTGLAGGTPEFLNERISRTQGLLNDQVKSGILTPEEANKRLEDYRFRLVRGTITGEALKMTKAGKANEVDGFLDEFRRTKNGMVDDYQRGLISDFAHDEVKTELTRAKTEQSAALQAAKRQVKDASEVWWKGERYAVDDAEVMRTAQATGDIEVVKDAQAALTARTAMKSFSLQRPQEQQRILSDMGTGGAETPDSLKLKEKLGGIYKETESAISSGDTLPLASRRGIVTADPIDPAQPATMQKRALDIKKADQFFGVESNPLQPVEKAQLVKAFDGLDSEGKIALYDTLKQNMGYDLTQRAMHQLGQDRPAMAVAMSISDDDPAVARKILIGDLTLKESKGSAVGEQTDLRQTYAGHGGGIFAADPVAYEAHYQAALALFAETRKSNPEADSGDFEKAIDTVMGGVIERNGVQTVPPKRGMSQDDFDALIDGMKAADFQHAAGGHKLAYLNGAEVGADTIHDKGIFQWVGGNYILKLSVGGTPDGETVFLAGDDGKLLKDKWGRPIPAELSLGAQ